MSRDRSTFEQCILASGLLTERQLDDACAGMLTHEGVEYDATTPPTDKELADRLVQLELLNVWQVKQLREGRTKFNLGPYRIIDSVGQGGMGHVFKARHEKSDRVVAIKVLPRYKSTPEAVQSFAREVQAAAALQHPKLVTALDSGQDGSVHYLVTEFVPGQDLRKWVRRNGPLTMEAAASIISQVANGLQYAHAMGIVHRDVKPGNVLVTPEGEAKLSDLGLAEFWVTAKDQESPQYSKIVGTADYLSPDQVLNPGRPTPVWDIYSLGCTLYYAATGKVPFPGGTTADKARAHCDLRPLDPRRLNATLSTEFVDIMADMMAKDPTQRISSAAQVVARLAPFVSGQPIMSEASAGVPPTLQSPPYASPAPLQGARPVVIPPSPRMPFGMAWTEEDTLTDASNLMAGRDDDSSGNLVDSFDLKMLDEEVVPAIKIPLRNRRRKRTNISPLTILLVSPVVLFGLLFVLHWLAKMIWPHV